jgi:predicted  nucleic acid-binding Zn-ribbon protein
MLKGNLTITESELKEDKARGKTANTREKQEINRLKETVTKLARDNEILMQRMEEMNNQQQYYQHQRHTDDDL